MGSYLLAGGETTSDYRGSLVPRLAGVCSLQVNRLVTSDLKTLRCSEFECRSAKNCVNVV